MAVHSTCDLVSMYIMSVFVVFFMIYLCGVFWTVIFLPIAIIRAFSENAQMFSDACDEIRAIAPSNKAAKKE